MTAPADVLAAAHLHALCAVSPDRRPGSPGNDAATGYVARELRELGWDVSEQVFDVMDWSGSPGTVSVGRQRWTATPSPYSLGVKVSRPLVVARTAADLQSDLTGQVVLLIDELASEQLTPIDYPFYSVPAHAAVLARLMRARPAVVLAGTGRAPMTAGGVEPFPLIEDGAFTVPTANLHLDDAAVLARSEGETVHVDVTSHRWPSRARNVVARTGPSGPRVVVVAHLDSKPGTPGAVDNAAGVVVLLLLAQRLNGRSPAGLGVELLAVNGEDCYSAAGETEYLRRCGPTLDEVVLAINVDGAGYRVGGSVFSLYEVPNPMADNVRAALAGADRLVEGPPWFQSDHMVFAQRGRPAVAVTTDHLELLLSDVAHTPADTPTQVDPTLLVGLSSALAGLVNAVGDGVTNPADRGSSAARVSDRDG